MNKKYAYLKAVLEYGCKIKKGETLLVIIPEEAQEEKNIIKSLKEEYGIKEIIFNPQKSPKTIYNFLKMNPTEKEIKAFIGTEPLKTPTSNLKCLDLSYSYNEPDKEQKLNYEILEEYQKYCNINRQRVIKTYQQVTEENRTISVIPTQSWANKVTNGDKEKLWEYLAKITPYDDIKYIIEHLEELKNKLNKLKLSKMHFEAKNGTNFDIKLSNYSLWQTVSENKTNTNFPSYEIYTAPTKNTINGKVIITKPTNMYGETINEGILTFENGLLVKCDTDNDSYSKKVMNNENKLNRVGEIALVAESPIKKENLTFHNIILDENAGCHLALGQYINTTVKKEKPKIFHQSNYHEDLIFDAQDLHVTGTKSHKTRTLINNDKWTI